MSASALPSRRAASIRSAPVIHSFSSTAPISNCSPSPCRKRSPSMAPGSSRSQRSIAIISNATKASPCWCSIQKTHGPISQPGARPDCEPTRRLISRERRKWLTAKRSRSALRSLSSAIRPRRGLAYSPASITPRTISNNRAICSTAMAQRGCRMSGSSATPRPSLAGFLQTVTGAKAVTDNSGIILPTRTGAIVLARPAAFECAFGGAPPHPQDGPHLAAFTIACQTLGQLADLPRNGNRHVLAPAKNFGTAIGFVETSKR